MGLYTPLPNPTSAAANRHAVQRSATGPPEQGSCSEMPRKTEERPGFPGA
jgi:hypothetical protein